MPSVRSLLLTGSLAACLALAPLSLAAPSVTSWQDDNAAQAEEIPPLTHADITLRRLFPARSFFGPSASQTSFSHDGRFGAYLYRPNEERRHGSDLHLYDTNTGEVLRITSVEVMSEFQASTRRVKEDRIKKIQDDRRRRRQAVEQEGDERLGDRVMSGDATASRDPRYSGISSYVWSPTANEMLVVSQGDLYRFQFDDEGAATIERLTSAQEGIRGVDYLPDGSGYTFLRGNALLKVTFGSHIIEQIDPSLPSGESMSGYRLSPDGKRLTFVTSRTTRSGGARTVNIARYRGRFMEVQQVSRLVSDDPRQQRDISYYLYDIDPELKEHGKLFKMYTHRITGPRDIFKVPNWSPDSSRIAFSVYEQMTGNVWILEAPFPNEEQVKEMEEERENPNDPLIHEPTLSYRFLHNGGPNTPTLIEPMYMADSHHLVFLTEVSGFRHLHRLDPLYEVLEPVTTGRYEVYPFAMSPDHKYIFATATREHLTRQDVYRIDPESGEMVRLTTLDGSYSNAAVSPDGSHTLASFVRYGTLRELHAINRTGDEPVETPLTDSHEKEAKTLTQLRPEFFTYNNRHGHEIHAQMFKPEGMEEGETRPLLIYVYGGPLSSNNKQVVEGAYSSDAYFFAYYMAMKHGYITVTIDPRGVSGYGGVFEKANFEQVGKPQVEDLVDGVKYLVEHHGVDSKRVAIHGWSFGGFQTQMCMYTAPEVFQVGIAGAGPTEWHNYNQWYSTGTIGDTREGRPDLEEFSLLPLAKNLEGRLLLVHGMEDSNVLYQDTVRVYSELLRAGKETLVELFVDPTGGHGLGGLVQRINRYRKYESFLLQHIGSGLSEAEIARREAEAEAKDDDDDDADDDADDDDDSDDDDPADDNPDDLARTLLKQLGLQASMN